MITLIGGCLHGKMVHEGEFNFLGVLAIPLDRAKSVYIIYTRPDMGIETTVAYFKEYAFRKET